jgi:hypothetical protein
MLSEPNACRFFARECHNVRSEFFNLCAELIDAIGAYLIVVSRFNLAYICEADP